MSGGLKTGEGTKPWASWGKWDQGLGLLILPTPWPRASPGEPMSPGAGCISLECREILKWGSSLYPQPTLPLPECCPGREGIRTLQATAVVALCMVWWPHPPAMHRQGPCTSLGTPHPLTFASFST